MEYKWELEISRDGTESDRDQQPWIWESAEMAWIGIGIVNNGLATTRDGLADLPE